MKRGARAVGYLVVAVGLLALAVPAALPAWGARLLTSGGLYVIAVFRVVIGVVLIEAARGSRMPRTLRVFGAVAIAAGLTTPFLGVGRAHAVLDAWLAARPVVVRLFAALAVGLGGLIVYATGDQRRP
jgi:hypothetical protein